MSKYAYALATAGDDATLRALLRHNPMPSWVSMATTREPSYFAGAQRFGLDWVVLAKAAEMPVGMYACAIQPVHVNGQPADFGYLGALRIQPDFRHKPKLLRGGFDSIHKLAPIPAPAVWYTAIASDNFAARRLLEAGLPGLPRYVPVNDLLTLAMTKAHGRKHGLWQRAEQDELSRLCDFYNQHARQYQFSPALTPEAIAQTGADFYVARHNGEIIACMALWNQQACKQVVARGYRAPLNVLRPLYNVYARCRRQITLPAPGHALDVAYLAFLAVASAHEAKLIPLIEDALSINSTQVLSLALHANHPWLPHLQRFRPAIYQAGIYAVSFAAEIELDGRPAQPEVAVL